MRLFTGCSCSFSRLIAFRRYSDLARSTRTLPEKVEICGASYATDEWTNVTPRIISLTERRLHHTSQNPINIISNGIKEHFADYRGFDYPSPVVDLDANFDSLLIKKDHVSRAKADTYYVNSNYLLRSHTSAHEAECWKQNTDSYTCIADVYRRDAIDRTHYPVFHQCEIAKLFTKSDIDEDIFRSNGSRTDDAQENHNPVAVKFVEGDIKREIETYVRRLLGKELKMRWVSAYFPFTHPSFELEIYFNNDWLEVLGAGVLEHKVLEKVGIHNKIGWALGFGLERLAMLKYSIPDIRQFWSRDSGFLSQFKNVGPWDSMKMKPVSAYPQCLNDISFWLPENQAFSPNDFYDLVRSVGGDLVEQVTLVDEFTNKKGRTSNCFRIVYRSCDRTLTQSEVNEVHEKIASTVTQQLDVEIR
ncbi:putative phenylalanine--tRNA ligase, mitochondrial [Halotydeus destructor]|nr:putative phenylalanine--tRNA ligase, mitochondrial [Halotydeus destructor]